MNEIDDDLFEELMKSIPRTFRDRANPFDSLNDEEFRLRYRFTRVGFYNLVEHLEDSITPSSLRSHALLPAQRLAVTLQVIVVCQNLNDNFV